MPAGIVPSSRRSATFLPLPSHSVHGVVTRLPEPPHCGHDDVRTNSPKTLRDTCCTRPPPPHVGQVIGDVPGSAPLPLHRSHVTLTWKGMSRVTPVAASASSSSTTAARSAPRARRVRPRAGPAPPPRAGAPPPPPPPPPADPEEVVAEEGGEDVRQVPEVERP